MTFKFFTSAICMLLSSLNATMNTFIFKGFRYTHLHVVCVYVYTYIYIYIGFFYFPLFHKQSQKSLTQLCHLALLTSFEDSLHEVIRCWSQGIEFLPILVTLARLICELRLNQPVLIPTSSDIDILSRPLSASSRCTRYSLASGGYTQEFNVPVR